MVALQNWDGPGQIGGGSWQVPSRQARLRPGQQSSVVTHDWPLFAQVPPPLVHVPEVPPAGIEQVRPVQQSPSTVQPDAFSPRQTGTHTCAVGSQLLEQQSVFAVHDRPSCVQPRVHSRLVGSHKPVQHWLSLVQLWPRYLVQVVVAHAQPTSVPSHSHWRSVQHGSAGGVGWTVPTPPAGAPSVEHRAALGRHMFMHLRTPSGAMMQGRPLQHSSLMWQTPPGSMQQSGLVPSQPVRQVGPQLP
jgi:hypothetical protein